MGQSGKKEYLRQKEQKVQRPWLGGWVEGVQKLQEGKEFRFSADAGEDSEQGMT